MNHSICGADCAECMMKNTCKGCVETKGCPFGKQCFKFASLSLWPMGKNVNTNFGKHPIANIIWLVFGGLEIAIGFLIAAGWIITEKVQLGTHRFVS